MKLSIEDLVDVGRGAAFLGTGGGGDPYVGRMLATHAIQEFGMPELVAPEDVADDAQLCTVAMLGAPTVLTEKAACGDDVDLAVRRMEKYLGRSIDAILPVEIGGVNSMLPIMAAARCDLPLVDADGMGRAFPEIQMVSFNIYGVSCTPLVVTDDHLNSLVVDTGTAKRAEDLVRVASIEMGCSVILSSYSMSGADMKRTAVHGTMSLALEIGRAIARGRHNGNPIDALIRHLRTTPYYSECRVLFTGKVTDLRRETTRGFAIGHCRLSALDSSDRVMEVTFQNEHLVARENGEVRAIVPDLICMVDSETAEPIPVEALKYGQRIRVIGVSAPPVLRTPEALAVVGPQAFGLEDAFVPIENLPESSTSSASPRGTQK
ncbi:DUF917 domain-containing protein [Elongatibacter sediminis]|uniref:DUF917 domain-containing protein n=1 Tax=Elongatibacter sediminis TaxID=3119006 RepID=A0AAW9RHZ2_9GAMM